MVQTYNNTSITLHLEDGDYDYIKFISETLNISPSNLLRPYVKLFINDYKKIDEERTDKLYKDGYGPIIW